MESHYPKITGYRTLSETEINLVSEGKALAEQCGAYIAKLRSFPDTVRFNPDSIDSRPALDQRWISIGATDLQRGFMEVIRGIAQPSTF